MKKILTLSLALAFTGCGNNEPEMSDLKIVGGKASPNDKSMKGLYPFVIGFRTLNATTCTASRIAQNTYLTVGALQNRTTRNHRYARR